MFRKKHKHKILFISTTLGAGGAERNMLNIIDYLHKNNKSSDIVLLKNKNEFKEEYSDLLKKTQVISILSANKINPILLPIYYLYTFILLVWRIFLLNPRLIVGVEEFVFLPTIIVGYVLRINTLLIVGNNEIEGYIKIHNKWLRPFFKKLLCTLLVRATRVVCVSKGLVQQLENSLHIPKNKITLVENGINIDHIYDIKTRGHSSKFTCVILGRLVKQKGIFLLIDSFKMVLVTIPKAKLIIMGDGPERGIFEQYTKNMGIINQVSFTGLQARSYLSLLKANVFLFSSIYEGFGNVIVEAMACGLPIISTNCKYGPLEILTGSSNYNKKQKSVVYGKYGILIPNQDDADYETRVSLLAREIIKLFKDQKLQNHYRKQSLKRCQDFTAERMARKYAQLFDTLLK